jgi:glycosyltransferase involved in cell wall biosynthesis
MKTSIVTTTINLPRFLDEYVPNLEKYGHKDWNIIIVGDTKTPEESGHYILDKFFDYGKDGTIEFFNIKKQESWINEHYPKLKEEVGFAIPYQSVRRRNFGYLRALELGSDVIITIDDDNYPTGDWLGEHINAFTDKTPTVFSPNRTVNPCNMLGCNHSPIYMRGYPISEIYSDEFVNSIENKNKVVLNMGLWTNKPDVDSYTNIIYPDLVSNKINNLIKRYALSLHHFIPINTQNTAFLKEVLPAYYLLFQDTAIYENKIDRFDDIWSGFILQKISHALGHTVSFGIPLAEHRRNTHDYNKDLKAEFSGIVLNDKTVKMIIDANLDCTSYNDGYIKMTDYIEKVTKNKFHPEVEIYFKRMIRAMRIWSKIIYRWM